MYKKMLLPILLLSGFGLSAAQPKTVKPVKKPAPAKQVKKVDQIAKTIGQFNTQVKALMAQKKISGLEDAASKLQATLVSLKKS